MSKIDLKVTRENLPEQLESLASDISYWETALAEAQNKLYLAELEKDVLVANTNIDIRTNPLKYGNLKVTDAAVGAICQTDTAVVEAERAVIAAKLEVANTKAVVSALDAKRSACKYLSELLVSGRFN
jgi:hypothetical protein